MVLYYARTIPFLFTIIYNLGTSRKNYLFLSNQNLKSLRLIWNLYLFKSSCVSFCRILSLFWDFFLSCLALYFRSNSNDWLIVIWVSNSSSLSWIMCISSPDYNTGTTTLINVEKLTQCNQHHSSILDY